MRSKSLFDKDLKSTALMAACYVFRGWQNKKWTVTVFHLHIQLWLKGLKGVLCAAQYQHLHLEAGDADARRLAGFADIHHVFPDSQPTVPATGPCSFLPWLNLSYLPHQRASGVHRYVSSHLSAPYAPPSQSDTPSWFSVWSSQNCLNPRNYLK